MTKLKCIFNVSVACSFMTFYARACHLSTRKSHMTEYSRPPRSVFQAFCRSRRAAQVNHIRVRARFVWRLQAQAKQMRPFLALFSYSFPDTRVKTRSFRHDRASHPSSLRFFPSFYLALAPVIHTNDRRQGHMTVTLPIGPNICGLFAA